MLSRMSRAEARLDMLEDEEKQCRNCPSATASKIEKLNAKLAEYEDRQRRVNLRIYGFPECCEGKDAISSERVRNLARDIRDVSRQGHKTGFYQDFSKAIQDLSWSVNDGSTLQRSRN